MAHTSQKKNKKYKKTIFFIFFFSARKCVRLCAPYGFTTAEIGGSVKKKGRGKEKHTI